MTNTATVFKWPQDLLCFAAPASPKYDLTVVFGSFTLITELGLLHNRFFYVHNECTRQALCAQCQENRLLLERNIWSWFLLLQVCLQGDFSISRLHVIPLWSEKWFPPDQSCNHIVRCVFKLKVSSTLNPDQIACLLFFSKPCHQIFFLFRKVWFYFSFCCK